MTWQENAWKISGSQELSFDQQLYRLVPQPRFQVARTPINHGAISPSYEVLSAMGAFKARD